ncbi:hypothetical protein, partial [Paraburkholderia kururiensis]
SPEVSIATAALENCDLEPPKHPGQKASFSTESFQEQTFGDGTPKVRSSTTVTNLPNSPPQKKRPPLTCPKK